MLSFKFLFGCQFAVKILSDNITDNLSASLQSKTITAAEGQELAAKTVLQNMRNDETFDNFWELVYLKKLFEVEDPKLSRKRRAPKRIDEYMETTHDSEEREVNSSDFSALCYNKI